MALPQGPYYVELGRRIRAARLEAEMTQHDLANLVGLTRTSITNIEKGRQPIPIHILAEIAGHVKAEVLRLLPPNSLLKKNISDRLIKYSDDERRWITMV